MPYERLSFDEFERRLRANRYSALWAAKIAIKATSWDEKIKARAFVLVDKYFRVDEPLGALEHLQRAIELMPELRPHLAPAFQILQGPVTNGVRKVRGSKPLRPSAGEGAPVDIATMFDAPDDELEVDPEEGPVTHGPLLPVMGSDPVEVARVCAERPDLENAIAEGDADDGLDAKQKAALRVAAGKLMEIRDKKGVS